MNYWHWWVLAGLLLIAELAAFGSYYLLVLALAAAVVGLTALLLPDLAWTTEATLFAVLSLLGLALWHRYRPKAGPSDAPTLNRRGESYIGRNSVLDEPISNGVGRLRVDDGQWRITGTDLPAGARVRVTRVEGATLHVERLE